MIWHNGHDRYSNIINQYTVSVDNFNHAYNKPKQKKIRHCHILKKTNDNAYKVKLPKDVKISNVFNIEHLTPMIPGKRHLAFRTCTDIVRYREILLGYNEAFQDVALP